MVGWWMIEDGWMDWLLVDVVIALSVVFCSTDINIKKLIKKFTRQYNLSFIIFNKFIICNSSQWIPNLICPQNVECLHNLTSQPHLCLKKIKMTLFSKCDFVPSPYVNLKRRTHERWERLYEIPAVSDSGSDLETARTKEVCLCCLSPLLPLAATLLPGWWVMPFVWSVLMCAAQ